MASVLIERSGGKIDPPPGLGFDPSLILGGVSAVGGIANSLFGKKDTSAKDLARAQTYAANVESYTGRVQSLQAAQLAEQRTEMWLWIAGLGAVAVVATGAVIVAKRRSKK